jgi:ribosome modulation factor
MARPWRKGSAWPYVAKGGRKSYAVGFYDHDKTERSRSFPTVRQRQRVDGRLHHGRAARTGQPAAISTGPRRKGGVGVVMPLPKVQHRWVCRCVSDSSVCASRTERNVSPRTFGMTCEANLACLTANERHDRCGRAGPSGKSRQPRPVQRAGQPWVRASWPQGWRCSMNQADFGVGSYFRSISQAATPFFDEHISK